MRGTLFSWGVGAIASTLIAAPSAAGTLESAEFTFALTNPTGTDWSSVLFVIEPDENAMANQPGYAALFAQVVFPEIEGPGGQEISGKSASIVFNDPQVDQGQQEVLFDFAANDPLTGTDGFVIFTLTVETPDLDGVPFEIRFQPIFVPSPGAIALFGLGSLALLRRRIA